MLQQNELISVIIPAYNAQKYLRTCIESVVNQTYRNLEILIIDDGSSDCTGGICDEYASNDHRIKVIHQENRGLSAARNTGLGMCTGDYIFFLDSDDYLTTNALQLLYEALNSTNSDLVIGNYCMVSEDGTKTIPVQAFNGCIYPNIVNEYDVWKTAILPHMAITVVWTKLYRRSLWSGENNNLLFPQGKIHEDTYVLPFILEQCDKYVFLNETIVYYRQSPNSIMHRQFSTKNLSWCEHHMNIICYLQKKEYYDIAFWYFKETARLFIRFYDSFREQNIGLSEIKKAIRNHKRLAYGLLAKPSRLSDKVVYALFAISFHLYKIQYSRKKRLQHKK